MKAKISDALIKLKRKIKSHFDSFYESTDSSSDKPNYLVGSSNNSVYNLPVYPINGAHIYVPFVVPTSQTTINNIYNTPSPVITNSDIKSKKRQKKKM